MLQPSLSGDARISVICTLNPDISGVAESTSTLLFAQRIKKVQLNAKKKEVIDTDALLERYRQEIEELKNRLSEKEKDAEAPEKGRRLSAREVILNDTRSQSSIDGTVATGREQGDEGSQRAHQTTHEPHPYKSDG
jgi:centromeric protein E